MTDIIWLDDIETDGLRIGIDEWGGLHFDGCSERVALDPNVTYKIFKARAEIV